MSTFSHVSWWNIIFPWFKPHLFYICSSLNHHFSEWIWATCLARRIRPQPLKAPLRDPQRPGWFGAATGRRIFCAVARRPWGGGLAGGKSWEIPYDYWKPWSKNGVPSGKPTKNYGKSPFLMGKSTINDCKPSKVRSITSRIWVNFITTSLFSLTGIMVRLWGIIPKWPNYSGLWIIIICPDWFDYFDHGVYPTDSNFDMEHGENT